MATRSKVISSVCPPNTIICNRSVSWVTSPLSVPIVSPSMTLKRYGFAFLRTFNPLLNATEVSRKLPVAPESIIALSCRPCKRIFRKSCCPLPATQHSIALCGFLGSLCRSGGGLLPSVAPSFLTCLPRLGLMPPFWGFRTNRWGSSCWGSVPHLLSRSSG